MSEKKRTKTAESGRDGGLRAPPWLPEHEQLLTDLWGKSTPQEIMALLPGRNWTAILARSRKLSLPWSSIQGYSRITPAAEARLFDYKTLLRIIKWAGLKASWFDTKTQRFVTSVEGRKLKAAKLYDCGEIDEAISDFMETESAFHAARARDIPRGTLDNWLRADKLLVPKYRNGGSYRIPSTLIDACVKRHSNKPVQVHARERGIPRQSLMEWLVAAGVKRPKVPKKKIRVVWHVSDADVARAIEFRKTQMRVYAGSTASRLEQTATAGEK